MSKESLVYVHHMLDAVKKIQGFVVGFDEKSFLNNVLVQDAVIRNLEIIGEAAKKVPAVTRAKYLDIDWKRIAGMRDILIHEYFGVDLEKVWRVVEIRLPKLKKELNKILST
jgi:uncharacterized protein with HEPN domain